MFKAEVKHGYVQDHVVPVSRHAFINIPQLYCEANFDSSYTRSPSSACLWFDFLINRMAKWRWRDSQPPFWICPAHEALDPGDLEAAAKA